MREKILLTLVFILITMLVIDNIKLNKQYEIIKNQQEIIEDLTSKLVGAGGEMTKEEMILLFEANEKFQKIGAVE
jgi:hypothetical protein